MSETLVKYGDHPRIPPGSVCEVCGKGPTVTDHCHQHGWVRGLVCTSCNMRMSFIDRRIAPKGGTVILAALLALRHRCPDCGHLDADDLADGMPREPRPDMKQVALRFPDDLHERVKVTAKRDHRSLQAQMLAYAERCLREDQERQAS